MHSSTALSLCLLALAGPASVLAQARVTVWDEATTIVTVTAGDSPPTPPAANVEKKVADNPPPPAASTTGSPPPPASSSADSSSGSGNGGGDLKGSNGQICVHFSGNDNFHWLNTGSWGSKSGSGAQSASQCFDPSANAGMYICESECQDAGDAATARYTKLECTLGGQWQNCDISLVDGFSLPLQCSIPGALPAEKIGGTVDLDSMDSCPSSGDDNTCKNSNAYESNAGAVSQYFQNGNWDPNSSHGNNYCVYQTCSAQSDTFFSGTPTIECVVGKRGGGSSKSKREDSDSIFTKRVGGPAAHAHRRHAQAHAYARGVKDLVV